MSKINMTGWIMKEHGVPNSRLTVMEEDKLYKKEHNLSTTSVYWKCLCECGQIKTVSSASLRQGKVLSCGCLRKEICSTLFIKDVTNQVFGFLTAIRPTEKRHYESVVWECQCICGQITYVPIGNLVSGHTRSCGCKRNELASNSITKNIEIGIRFNHLVVLEKYIKTENDTFTHTKWKCLCDCGNIILVDGTKLRNGHTQSCGCINSKGEEKIKDLLNQNNIKFITQKKFNDCVSDKNNPLPFDFYIEDKFLVEFDGIQHYEPVELFGGEQAFVKRRQYDEIKNKYCFKNNIPIKRIPYWVLEKLTIEDIMSDKYLLYEST